MSEQPDRAPLLGAAVQKNVRRVEGTAKRARKAADDAGEAAEGPVEADRIVGEIQAPQVGDGAIEARHVRDGEMEVAKFAEGLRPVQLVEELPSLPDGDYPDGAVVFDKSQGKLFGNENGAWVSRADHAEVSAEAVIAGTVEAGAIGADELNTVSARAEILKADVIGAEQLASMYMEVGKYIRSSNYRFGLNGWAIDADGNAEFNDVTIRGSQWTGGSASFASGNLTLDGDGITLAAGSAGYNSVSWSGGQFIAGPSGNLYAECDYFDITAQELFASGRIRAGGNLRVDGTAQFSTGTWHESTDGNSRLHFSSGSHTYLRTASHIYFRNSSNNNIARMLSSGTFTAYGNITASGGRLYATTSGSSSSPGVRVGNSTTGIYRTSSSLGVSHNGNWAGSFSSSGLQTPALDARSRLNFYSLESSNPPRAYITIDGGYLRLENHGSVASSTYDFIRVLPLLDVNGDLGDNSYRWRRVYTRDGLYGNSDDRTKTDVRPTPLGLDFVREIEPIRHGLVDQHGSDKGVTQRESVAAQRLAEAVARHGTDPDEWVGVLKPENDDGYWMVQYEALIPPLIKAVQELADKVDAMAEAI